jgi:hypothetical protein
MPVPQTTGETTTTEVDDFLIARGGPFWELQRQLGLVHERALHAGRRAALSVAVAWGVPLLLSLLAGRALGPASAHPFLLDPGAWARFLVAVAVFVLMEGMVEQRLKLLLRQFAAAPLVPPAEMPKAAAAVVRALKRRDASGAEAAALVMAVAVSSLALWHRAGDTGLSWLAVATPDGARLTAAGWWAGLVSNTLFFFLLLRWLWRYLVWGLLLHDLARLDLRLVATHPDGMGGLAFIGRYPNVFAAFVFALGSVVAAALARALLAGELDIRSFPIVMGVWLVVVVLLFALPLAAFAAPLRRLKETTLAACAAGAIRYQRAVERELLGHNMAAERTEAERSADLPDPSKIYAQVGKLGTLPVSRSALLPLGAAALLPLVAVGATQMPVKDILKIAKGLLL